MLNNGQNGSLTLEISVWHSPLFLLILNNNEEFIILKQGIVEQVLANYNPQTKSSPAFTLLNICYWNTATLIHLFII